MTFLGFYSARSSGFSAQRRQGCHAVQTKAIFQANGNIHVVFISEGNVLIGDRTLVRDQLNKIGLSAFKGAVPSQGNNRKDICFVMWVWWQIFRLKMSRNSHVMSANWAGGGGGGSLLPCEVALIGKGMFITKTTFKEVISNHLWWSLCHSHEQTVTRFLRSINWLLYSTQS